jgi:dTDP-4-dehydrorhamnose 3,5-epimerase-like enzyme
MLGKTISISSLGDERGGLISLESCDNVPFEIKRVYSIFANLGSLSRGFHAHKKLKQFVVCLSGSCQFLLDDGREKKEIVLSSPYEGLLIEGLVWREMHDFSSDCVLIVLADQHYDESDYIRDYQEFLDAAQ